MDDPFLDSATREGQGRIREYVLGWLERLDYRGRLDRDWSADALGARIWRHVEGELAAHWPGSVVTSRDLAEVIAAAAVEDYFAAYPRRRPTRYAVAGPLPDAGFRRCVLDFVHDLEEFEPAALPATPEAVAAAFRAEVEANPERWGCSEERGPFVDDPERAARVAVETVREYFDLLRRAAEARAGKAAG